MAMFRKLKRSCCRLIPFAAITFLMFSVLLIYKQFYSPVAVEESLRHNLHIPDGDANVFIPGLVNDSRKLERPAITKEADEVHMKIPQPDQLRSGEAIGEVIEDQHRVVNLIKKDEEARNVDLTTTVYHPNESLIELIDDTDAIEALKTYHFKLRSSDENVQKRGSPGKNGERCQNITYDLSVLPTSAVIISFHENERVESILHTIHSIFENSPRNLLKEILLVDDNSRKASHKEPMENYINEHFPPDLVKIRRHNGPENLGLIQGRLLAAKMATAQVIVCMDAHMEVQPRWLEPILQAIYNQKNIMATAMLDWMRPLDSNPDLWYYQYGSSRTRTTFVWKTFNFGFRDSRNMDLDNVYPVEPFDTPMSVGTIWAMDREFFFEIGAFDDKMVLWGGENADLPIRVYLCGGGRVVNIPCSHAAHQEIRHQRDYRYGWRSKFLVNFRRIGDVWLDGEYKETYYYYNSNLLDIDPGDLTERLKLKEEKCPRPFSYFMKNNYPELGVDAISFGWKGMMHMGTQQCFYYSPDLARFKMEKCATEPTKEQSVFLSIEGYLRQFLSIFSLRFSVNDGVHIIQRNDALMDFYHLDRHTRWIHTMEGCVYAYEKKLCLGVSDGHMIGVPCDGNCKNNATLQWRFQKYTHYYQELSQGDFKAFNMTKLNDREYYMTYRNTLMDMNNASVVDVSNSEQVFDTYRSASSLENFNEVRKEFGHG